MIGDLPRTPVNIGDMPTQVDPLYMLTLLVNTLSNNELAALKARLFTRAGIDPTNLPPAPEEPF